MTDGLLEWLGKQLDEDERIAKEAGVRSLEWRLATPLDDEELGDASWLRPPELKHAERHDPARVLREVEAKRAVIARYEFACREAGRLALAEEEREVWVQVAGALQSCVLCLAVIYADRPGYDEARHSAE